MKSVSLGLTWSCRWYMLCDKAVMSQPQVARRTPHPPSPRPTPPPHVHTACVENGSTVSASQRTFISPHLCGLRRDDLGLKPSQPSCHLRKKKRGGGGGRAERKEKEGEGGAEESCLIPLLSFTASSCLECFCLTYNYTQYLNLNPFLSRCLSFE